MVRYKLPESFQLDISRQPGGKFRLAASQVLPVSLETAFSFFEAPRNLAYITPPWLEFRLVDDGGGKVYEGVELQYTIKWLHLHLLWRSRIVCYHPPYEFTDIQIAGPYRKWTHHHAFSATSEGTLMKDRVDYKLPLGLAGRLTHTLIVERQLRDIFTYRSVKVNDWASGRK